ncbi:MAG: PilZ domain-containing protein [Actinobacteria bacterium]|nr:PilZ domain-containing protein [Actinomycetota bacterium]
MRAREVLRPGRLIFIEINPGERRYFAIGFVSDDCGTLTCELLTEQPRSIDVDESEELLAICTTERGIYKFLTRVIEVEQDPVRLTLSLLKKIVHIQRREFFRLSRPCVLAKYRPVNGPEDILSGELIDASIKDLSGNGIALIIPVENVLASGTPVRIEIELAGGQLVGLIGQVARCIPNEPMLGKSLLCVRFELIDEWDRDYIISQLFKERIDRIGKRHRLPRRP